MSSVFVQLRKEDENIAPDKRDIVPPEHGDTYYAERQLIKSGDKYANFY